MADDVTASFNLNVESNAKQIADDGAEGLANFQEKMAGSVEELKNLNTAFRQLKGGAGVSAKALDELKGRIGAQKAAIAAQQQAYLKAGGTFKELGDRQRARAANELAQAKAKAAADKKAKADAQDKAKLTKADIASSTALGQVYVELAKKALAVSAAVIRTTASFFAYGVQVADTRRSELLALEGMTKIRYGLWGMGMGYRLAADKAGFLQEQIDEVSANSAIGRDKVAGYAAQLYKTGLRAGNLQFALEGMTTTAATQGEEQAQRFAMMAAGARMAGISVKKLADDVKARLGGIAEAQMLSLTAQSQKLRESFAMLFSGLKIDKLLRGLKSVTSIFQQNTAEGMALKQLLTSLFQPLIDGAPTAGLLVRKVIQGMIIAALELHNRFLDLQIAWYSVFGASAPLKNAEIVRLAVLAGKIAIGGLAGVATSAAIGISLLVAGLLGLPVAIGMGVAKLESLHDKLKQTYPKALHAGKMLAAGLAAGIFGGIPGVIAAVSMLGGEAIKAFHQKLDMHSPSKVMIRDTKVGYIGGIQQGMRQGKSTLEKEVRDSVTRPMMQIDSEASGKAAASAAPSRSAQPMQISFGDIKIEGAVTMADVEEGIRRGVEALFAGKLVLVGG